MEESVEVGELLDEDVGAYVDCEVLAGVAGVQGEVSVRSGAKRVLISTGVSIGVTDEVAAEGEEEVGRSVVLKGAGLSIDTSVAAIG